MAKKVWSTSNSNIKNLSNFDQEKKNWEKKVSDIVSKANAVAKYMDVKSWQWKIQWYKNYMLYNADRKLELKKKNMSWRTNFKTPLTRIMVDSVYNKTFDSSFDIEVFATNEEQIKKTGGQTPKDSVDALNNRAYVSSEVEENLKKACKDWVSTGDWYLMIGMKQPKEKKLLLASNEKDEEKKNKEVTISECAAIAEYKWWEKILYNSKVWFYESDFVWYREVEDIDQLLDRHSNLITMSEDFKEKLRANNSYSKIFDKDYTIHRDINAHSDEIINSIIKTTENDIYTNRWKKWETYEEWTKETLVIIHNGILLYDGPNPIGDIPFVALEMWINPNGWINLWISQMLLGIQELYDLVYNWYSDFLKRHYNPMFMTTGWQWIEWFDGGHLDWEPYKIIKNLWEGKIERMNLWDDINWWFEMLNNLWNMAGQIAWVTRYTSANLGSGIERSARASDYQVQITLETTKAIVFSMTKALNRISKLWCLMAKTKLPEKSIVSIVGKDNKEVFKKIKLEDLAGEYIIRYKSETLDAYYKQRELDNITSFLNYEKMVGEDPITWTFVYDQPAIAKKVADLHQLYWVVLSAEDIIKRKKDFDEIVARELPQQNDENWIPFEENSVNQDTVPSLENGTQDSNLSFEEEIID